MSSEQVIWKMEANLLQSYTGCSVWNIILKFYNKKLPVSRAAYIYLSFNWAVEGQWQFGGPEIRNDKFLISSSTP